MNILIADDHPLIVEGLTSALRDLHRDAHIHVAHDAPALLAHFERGESFGLVMMDGHLPGMDCPALVTRIRALQPEAPVVVLSAHDTRKAVTDALDAGARGFIPKCSATPILLGALRLVLSGGIYIPPQILAPVSQSETDGQSAPALHTFELTNRQKEVLALLVEGKPNKLICRELNVSEGTVKTHVSAIFRALNVTNRAQAAFVVHKLARH